MLFDDYVQDRKYLRNVSPKTLIWYGDVWKAFGPHLDLEDIRGSLRKGCIALLERGVKPVSINSWLTGVRAYVNWLWKDGKLKEKPRVELLKAEQKIIQTLSAEQVKQLVQFKATGTNQKRAHTFVCLLLDTGLRASEALSLTKADVDLDGLTVQVTGKGGKHRRVPISLEGRKVLYRATASIVPSSFVFATNQKTPVSLRNIERDMKAVGKRVGITGVRFSPHTLRHSFAVNYLRRGGNLAYLQRILGHSSISVTERYLRSIGIEDLKEVHSGLSLLSR